MARASFTIEMNQQVLMIRPIGAWGETIASDFVKQVNQYLASGKAEFAGIIDLRKWELGTPVALAIIGKNIFYAASLGYTLEVHFGQPKSIPMQVSEKKVTPEEVQLLQSNDPDEVSQLFKEHGYQFDSDRLTVFLESA